MAIKQSPAESQINYFTESQIKMI